MLALAYSSWINAWTLRCACAELGVDLRVPAGVRELPLPALVDGARPHWIFFTEEDGLRRALQGEVGGRFLPKHFPAELLDDKWAFTQFLATDASGPQGLQQWSLPEAGAVPFPILLKSRHSWVAGRKLPRGWVCATADELGVARKRLRDEGLDEAWYFLQEWLGDQAMRLLSVCGFYDDADASRRLAVVTERVADYGAPGLNSSAMLVTVDDEFGLTQAAAHVLQRLRFSGPYEMEFIVRGRHAQALELNPRFWMQHGLFLAAGNGLVKRYLELDDEADRRLAPPQDLLWVDGTWLLRRLIRFDFRVFRLWRHWVWERGNRPVICPTIGQVVRAGLWRVCGGGR